MGGLRLSRRGHCLFLLPARARSLISSIFQPLFGSRATDGPLGKLIDVMALIATLFGTAATLGLSAIQIGQGVSIIAARAP